MTSILGIIVSLAFFWTTLRDTMHSTLGNLFVILAFLWTVFMLISIAVQPKPSAGRKTP